MQIACVGEQGRCATAVQENDGFITPDLTLCDQS